MAKRVDRLGNGDANGNLGVMLKSTGGIVGLFLPTPVEVSQGRVDGCREWGIKVFCDEKRLVAALAEPAIVLPGAAAAALSRILAKQQRALAVQRAGRRVAALPDEVLDVIERHVLEVAEKPVGVSPPDARGTCVARLSALVPPGSEHAFRAALRALGERVAREGVSFELTSPRALYGFVDMDEPRVAEAAEQAA